jgi:hypothetical protein
MTGWRWSFTPGSIKTSSQTVRQYARRRRRRRTSSLLLSTNPQNGHNYSRLSPQDIVSRKVSAINLFVALASRQAITLFAIFFFDDIFKEFSRNKLGSYMLLSCHLHVPSRSCKRAKRSTLNDVQSRVPVTTSPSLRPFRSTIHQNHGCRSFLAPFISCALDSTLFDLKRLRFFNGV